jgi:hypothetical protein
MSANTQKNGTCRLMGCDRPRYFVILVIPVLCNIPQHGCKATGAVDLLAAFRWPRRAVASARCRAIGLFEGVAWWVTKRCDVPKTMKSFFLWKNISKPMDIMNMDDIYSWMALQTSNTTFSNVFHGIIMIHTGGSLIICAAVKTPCSIEKDIDIF